MLERELKLHVPAASRNALENELRHAGAIDLALRARYFDTPGRDLARAGIALRLRLEGDEWVQTAKTSGPDELTRMEFNHPRPGPELDLSVYEATALASFFARLDEPLLLRYETLVNRLVLREEGQGGTVELAFDRGTIRAGRLEQPVCELELEQMGGSSDYLFSRGRHWLERHRLVLDLRGKAERGSLLAEAAMLRTGRGGTGEARRGADAGPLPPPPPRHARPVALSPGMNLPQAYRLCLNECLNHIVRNATLLATIQDVDAAAQSRVEYVHQLRVGIRRLRSCWKLFSKWTGMDDAAVRDELRRHFSSFGLVRNNDVIRTALAPRLNEAGMPELSLPDIAISSASDALDAMALASGAPFQSCLLVLMKHLVDQPAPDRGPATGAAAEGGPKADEPALGEALSARLNKWLRRLCRDGRAFAGLPIDARHDLRKRVKRLRYCLEFSEGALDGKKLVKVRTALTRTQKTLGELNDLYVAQDYYQALAADQPQALFALGWLKAMQAQKEARAQAAFAKLCRAGRVKPARPARG